MLPPEAQRDTPGQLALVCREQPLTLLRPGAPPRFAHLVNSVQLDAKLAPEAADGVHLGAVLGQRRLVLVADSRLGQDIERRVRGRPAPLLQAQGGSAACARRGCPSTPSRKPGWGSAPGDPPRHSRAQRRLAPSATRSREPPGTLARCGSDVAGCAARARGPGPVQKQGACGPQRDARGLSAGTSRQQLGCRGEARPRHAARSHGHTPDPAEGLDADAGAESPHAQSGRLPSVRPSPARRTPVTAPAHSSVTNVANPAGRGGSRSSHLLLQEARGFLPATPVGHTCGPHPRPRPVGKALWDPPRHSHVACRMWPLLGSNSPGQQHSETLGPI